MFPLASEKSVLSEKSFADFAERIKAARQKLELSQGEAARLWGFSHQLLGMWENGRRNPCGLYREKLEKILKRIE